MFYNKSLTLGGSKIIRSLLEINRGSVFKPLEEDEASSQGSFDDVSALEVAREPTAVISSIHVSAESHRG